MYSTLSRRWCVLCYTFASPLLILVIDFQFVQLLPQVITFFLFFLLSIITKYGRKHQPLTCTQCNEANLWNNIIQGQENNWGWNSVCRFILVHKAQVKNEYKLFTVQLHHITDYFYHSEEVGFQLPRHLQYRITSLTFVDLPYSWTSAHQRAYCSFP